jgi:hypothetical protein
MTMLRRIDRRLRVGLDVLAAYLCCGGFIVSIPVAERQAPEDAWETTDIETARHSELWQNCFQAAGSKDDHFLLIPVEQAQLNEALSRLETRAAIELADADAARYFGHAPAREGETFAALLLSDSIAALEEKKSQALLPHPRSFGAGTISNCSTFAANIFPANGENSVPICSAPSERPGRSPTAKRSLIFSPAKGSRA